MNPHLGPFHIASNVLIAAGFLLLYGAWQVLYAARREGRLATAGPYRRIRHPQYVGFVLILFGFLLQWPTLLTAAMFPVLVMYGAPRAPRGARGRGVAALRRGDAGLRPLVAPVYCLTRHGKPLALRRFDGRRGFRHDRPCEPYRLQRILRESFRGARMEQLVAQLIERWKADPGSTYSTWFLWEERLKNFRSIRQGIRLVSREISERRFGNAYRGSSLEIVVGSIAEQRQIFRGADHAFLWKPKLRIPDIYESEPNQLAFGRLLHSCDCCDTEDGVLRAVQEIEGHRIKGLGPAVANILYFIHPTLVPPFNTAIVRGYNAIAGAGVKLGRWDHYLAMRRGVLAMNQAHRTALSNDLGAVAGLLFDVGSGRYQAPACADGESQGAWRTDLQRVRNESAAHEGRRMRDSEGDRTHTEVQAWLRDLGRALGYSIWIAANDRGRRSGAGVLGDGCLADLSCLAGEQPESVPLIDVLWIDASNRRVAAAFEVEHTTSIYSGILRMLDLAERAGDLAHALFLVAPDSREVDVRRQLDRPAFARAARSLGIRYLPYGELERNREAIARFGAGLKPLHAIAKAL